jgi:hypothetical protein
VRNDFAGSGFFVTTMAEDVFIGRAGYGDCFNGGPNEMVVKTIKFLLAMQILFTVSVWHDDETSHGVALATKAQS